MPRAEMDGVGEELGVADPDEPIPWLELLVGPVAESDGVAVGLVGAGLLGCVVGDCDCDGD